MPARQLSVSNRSFITMLGYVFLKVVVRANIIEYFTFFYRGIDTGSGIFVE